jgi:hypothetical protein
VDNRVAINALVHGSVEAFELGKSIERERVLAILRPFENAPESLRINVAGTIKLIEGEPADPSTQFYADGEKTVCDFCLIDSDLVTETDKRIADGEVRLLSPLQELVCDVCGSPNDGGQA